MCGVFDRKTTLLSLCAAAITTIATGPRAFAATKDTPPIAATDSAAAAATTAPDDTAASNHGTTAGGHTPRASNALEDRRLKVFLDCGSCDAEYIQQTIKFVDYVRDRNDAQVHVLGTYQYSGTAITYIITLIGEHELAGKADTLAFSTRMSDTPDFIRSGYARMLKLGLAALAARSGVAEQLRVQYHPSVGDATNAYLPSQNDSWDHWAFSVGLNGSVMGERTNSMTNISSMFSADRSTARSRVSAYFSSYVYNTSVDLGTTKLSSHSATTSMTLMLVRTTGEHWGAGLSNSYNSSPVSNMQSSITTMPVVEFDVFPYSEYDRRSLTVSVGAGFEANDYTEETIYFKTRETLPRGSVGIRAAAAEPWGSSSLYVSAARFLNDASKNQLSAYGMSSFRVFRGFDLNVTLSASSIHDQVSLPRSNATAEDVLLRRRMLATSYYVSGKLGFTYTFGSALNKGINPVLRALGMGPYGY